MTATPPDMPSDNFTMQRFSRDVATLPDRLASWLATRLPAGAEPEVTVLAGADANGLSSETLSLDVTWGGDGGRRTAGYVARVAPSAADVPVFPSYELAQQYEVMRLVAGLTDVPVPRVLWLEETGEVLGTPFFLMERVDGVVPPDVLPYNFGDNWLHDATPEQQRALQDASVGVLAKLHAIPDAAATFGYLVADRPGATPLARSLAWTRRWYEFAAADIGRSPLVERGLAWLEANLPADEGDPVLCWGDARVGNIMYRDFAPVAVLDWEMATVGPRELDVSWMLFAHMVFESITSSFSLPGMPSFLREADVVATYESLSGVTLRPLTWFHLHNATQWGVIFMRTGARQIHFGEIERPDDIEGLMHSKPLMERLLGEAGA